MKVLSIFLFSALAVFADSYGVSYNLSDTPLLFLKFMKDYNRQYKDTGDVLLHFAAFVTNVDRINKQNKQSLFERFGINGFADLTYEELQRKHEVLYKKYHKMTF